MCQILDSKHLIQNKKHRKHRERQKPNFPKKITENADLHEPVLNKIMTA